MLQAPRLQQTELPSLDIASIELAQLALNSPLSCKSASFSIVAIVVPRGSVCEANLCSFGADALAPR